MSTIYGALARKNIAVPGWNVSKKTRERLRKCAREAVRGAKGDYALAERLFAAEIGDDVMLWLAVIRACRTVLFRPWLQAAMRR